MRVREASIARQGRFVASIEEHALSGLGRVWRYVIRRQSTGDELYDGWAGDLHEAVESVDQHLAYLSEEEKQLTAWTEDRLGRLGKIASAEEHNESGR